MAIDYNAAFTGAVARLVDFYDNMKPFSDCTLDLGWTHPNAPLVRPASAFSSGVPHAASIWLPLGVLRFGLLRLLLPEVYCTLH